MLSHVWEEFWRIQSACKYINPARFTQIWLYYILIQRIENRIDFNFKISNI